MTRDDFERAYAIRSATTVEKLRALGRVVRPCVCGADDCDGWQSVRVESDDDWPESSPFPKDDPRYRDVLFAGADGGVAHILSERTPPCPECGALPSTFHVEHYDPIWRDGDVMCPNGHRVRGYDAG
jgi:hypothetical protein